MDGRALCTAGNNQNVPIITADGAGGAIVTWQDKRTGTNDIYAQHVLSNGLVDGTWPADGRALCTAVNEQANPTLVADGANGAFVTWNDFRYGTGDIYVQRVSPTGGLIAVGPEAVPVRFRLLSPYPNPVRNDRLMIRFDLPSTQRVSAQVIDVAGHRVRTLVLDREFLPGSQSLVWDGRGRSGARLPNGVYFVQVRAGAYSDMRRIVLLR